MRMLTQNATVFPAQTLSMPVLIPSLLSTRTLSTASNRKHWTPCTNESNKIPVFTYVFMRSNVYWINTFVLYEQLKKRPSSLLMYKILNVAQLHDWGIMLIRSHLILCFLGTHFYNMSSQNDPFWNTIKYGTHNIAMLLLYCNNSMMFYVIYQRSDEADVLFTIKPNAIWEGFYQIDKNNKIKQFIKTCTQGQNLHRGR